MRTHLHSPALLFAAGAGCLAIGATAIALPATARPPAPAPVAATAATGADPTVAQITRTQQHLRQVPKDWSAWATLGLDYVSQARVTVDPTYYPKAQAAIDRSLRLNRNDNVIGYAGQAALAAARHQFPAALRAARAGLRIDPESAVLYGALTDALTQLGHYRAAAAAARHMELLRPGADAEARLSYAAELRGDLRGARVFMRTALRHSLAPSDVAFARYYLGELARTSGHPRAALRHYAAGLRTDSTSVQLLEGRAKARAALGDVAGAVHDFRAAVARTPQPAYLLEFGRYLESVGRPLAARRQYAVFRVEERLFRANGVRLDSDQTLFTADHGSAAAAIAAGRAAVRDRPFLDSDDAYGWALHRAGRDRAALTYADRSLRTGIRSALYLFHRGVIERALGRTTASRRDLTTALRLDPHFDPLDAPIARHLLRRAS